MTEVVQNPDVCTEDDATVSPDAAVRTGDFPSTDDFPNENASPESNAVNAVETNAFEAYSDITNTNRYSTKQLVTMALMCALSALFSFIQIPIFPAAPFLTYDPSLVPAMVCGFAFGAVPGVIVGIISVIIHGLMLGDWVGSLMNIVVTLCYVIPASLVYKKFHSTKGLVGGLCLGFLCVMGGAILANLTIGVLFWYGSVEVGLGYLWALVPFNVLKGVLNSVLTFVTYKAIAHFITSDGENALQTGYTSDESKLQDNRSTQSFGSANVKEIEKHQVDSMNQPQRAVGSSS